MLYSLVQTLVCVLLINGGLYALHLKGNANDEPKSMEPLLLPGLTNSHSEHSVQHASGSPYGSSASRLSEELADLAQLERERLMLLGIAKQTAVANAAAATGHHGRPIITGRIHMSPTDDVVSDGELARVLMPQPARGYMFGHVVKQPVQQNDGSDLQFAGGGMPSGTNNGGNGRDYEYGRIVKPAVVPEFDAQQVPLDLEAFMELEPESKSDEDDFDLDSYQYLDELLAEQQQRDWKQEVEHHRSNNPYQTVDDIDDGTPLALRELFNTEQQTSGYKHKGHQQQQQQQHQRQHQQQHSYPTNLRLQQKWLRKRAQQQQHGQQQPLRNIFDQKNHYQRSEESIAVKPPKPHYFNQRHHSLLLSTDNSEATANKNSHHNNQNNRAKMTSLVDEVMPATSNTRNHNSSPLEELQQQQEQQQQQVENQQSSSAASGLKEMDDKNNSKQDLKQNTSGTSSYSNIDKQQQQQSLNLELEKKPQEELLLHPNHKRSGLGSSLLAPVLSAAGSHSMASQLMLRTARGQRQYDVPQIGKSSIFHFSLFEQSVN